MNKHCLIVNVRCYYLTYRLVIKLFDNLLAVDDVDTLNSLVYTTTCEVEDSLNGIGVSLVISRDRLNSCMLL